MSLKRCLRDEHTTNANSFGIITSPVAVDNRIDQTNTSLRTELHDCVRRNEMDKIVLIFATILVCAAGPFTTMGNGPFIIKPGKMSQHTVSQNGLEKHW